MSKELAVPGTFAERIRDRLRELIGDVITDDDLTRFIERGIEEEFFHTQKDSYGRNTGKPIVHSMVRECLFEAMEKAVRRWLRDHEAEVMETVREEIEKGAAHAMMNGLNSAFKENFEQLARNINYNMRSY